MGIWFPENATKAYLNTIIMGESTREPNISEFISALAAGNNSQLIVVACANIADSITLALVIAAQQTGGRLICIVPGVEEFHASQKLLESNLSAVQLVIDDAKTAVLERYEDADFIAIDCDLEDQVLSAVEGRRRQKKNGIIVGYNAFRKGSWKSGGLDVEILPIGEGLLLRRIAAEDNNRRGAAPVRSKGEWIVRVDKCTGEEHALSEMLTKKTLFKVEVLVTHQVQTCT